jgi:hypothetical protein
MVDIASTSPGGMDGAGLGSGTVTSSSPTKESKSPSQDGSEDISNAGLTAAASHHALLMQGNPPSFSPPQDTGSKGLEPIGTLNVGDRFASTRQNSPETAQAASPGISGRATLSLTVPPPASTDPVVSGSPSSPVSQDTKNSSFSFSGFSSGHHSRRRLRSEDEEEQGRAFLQGFAQGSRRSTNATSPGSPSSPSPAAISPGTQRYVFNVHDVHDMGGTPSRLSILDAQSGDVLKSYNLSPGDSTLMADLPPGQYTIEAQSGSRSGNAPNAGRDDLDNFRVDVSSAGPTPSDGGMSGGGAVASPSK